MSPPTRHDLSQPRIGCVADDFIGAADVANVLVRGGVHTVLKIGAPSEPRRVDAG